MVHGNDVLRKQSEKLKALYAGRWESTNAMLDYLGFCARSGLEAFGSARSPKIGKISFKRKKALLDSVEVIAQGQFFSSLAGTKYSSETAQKAYRELGIRFYSLCLKKGLMISSRRGTVFAIPLMHSRKNILKLCIAQWLGVKKERLPRLKGTLKNTRLAEPKFSGKIFSLHWKRKPPHH